MKATLFWMAVASVAVLVGACGGGASYTCTDSGPCEARGGMIQSCCAGTQCEYRAGGMTFACSGSDCQGAAMDALMYCMPSS